MARENANGPGRPGIETNPVDQTNPAGPTAPRSEPTHKRRDPYEPGGANEPSETESAKGRTASAGVQTNPGPPRRAWRGGPDAAQSGTGTV